MTWVIVSFVVAAAIIIARIYFKLRSIQGTKQESWDAKIIEQLRSKGYAPFNEYKVDFFIALPDEPGHGVVFDGPALAANEVHGTGAIKRKSVISAGL